MLADRILRFLKSLDPQVSLPEGVEVLNPYQDKTAFGFCDKFYRKFYSDDKSRTLILGINPGRLGGGLTGIPFTDPIKLQDRCGITNELSKRAELSADFIYLVIDSFGGLEKFYSQFYFSSVSPLGFTKDGKNLNYYDIPELQKALKPFIVKSIQTQLSFGMNSTICFVLGEGKNFSYLKALNEEYKFFKRIMPLSHPRFVMQYKRKQLSAYTTNYIKKLSDFWIVAIARPGYYNENLGDSKGLPIGILLMAGQKKIGKKYSWSLAAAGQEYFALVSLIKISDFLDDLLEY